MKELPSLSGKYSYADLQEAITHVSDRDKFPLYKCEHPLAVQIIANWLDEYFEEEPKEETFRACISIGIWSVEYTPDKAIVGCMLNRREAKLASDWLNLHWNRRDQ